LKCREISRQQAVTIDILNRPFRRREFGRIVRCTRRLAGVIRSSYVLLRYLPLFLDKLLKIPQLLLALVIVIALGDVGINADA
jgi:hypothetical protein